MTEFSVSLFRGARYFVPLSSRKAINSAYETTLAYLPLKARLAIQYFKSFRTFPDFKNPKTFNEKCQHLKLQNDPRLPPRVDKIAAKQIVASAIGTEHVIPMLYSGNSLPPIAERNWPVPFVIKTNHGSGLNIFIRKESDKNWPAIDACLKSWLAIAFGHLSGELYYAKMKPQILVEPFIAGTGELPTDYKIFCFAGEPKYIQVDTDRESDHKRVFYDTNWERQSFRFGYPMEPRDIPRPDNLPLLLACAGKLAAGFGFMRTDFYVVDGKILFGEMGFTPEAGFHKFYPGEMDRVFGDMWPL